MRSLSLLRSGKAAFAYQPDQTHTETGSTVDPSPSGLLSFRVRSFVCRMLPLALGFVAFVFAKPTGALERWVVGSGGHSWKGVGTLETADVVEGRLGPKETDPQSNLALQAKVSSPSFTVQNLGTLALVADGDSTTAFEMSLEGVSGVQIDFDLGGLFFVDRIAFAPRAAYEDLFLRGYVIYVNDGTESGGDLVWKRVKTKRENTESRVTIRIPLQMVRNVRLESITKLAWEIGEFEIYGRGFAPKAAYLSDVIDLGDRANFGVLTWSAEVDPQASMGVVTRSGNTSDPFRYYELVQEGPDVKEVEVSKKEYDKLKSKQRTTHLDVENWSFWSAPYSASGAPFASPGPRRYVQFRMDFSSESSGDRAQADSLAFLYSSPPVARRIVGEISPGEVSAGETVEFTYALSGDFGPDDTGFDMIEISTPSLPAFLTLSIGGSPMDLSEEHILAEPDRLILRLPSVVRTRVPVELTFSCKVLVYGTIFNAKVFTSQTEELPQEVIEGDVVPHLKTDRLSVRVPLGGTLISSASVSPYLITPNGDDRNEVAVLTYALLKVLGKPAPVSVDIYDFSGASIWHHTEDRTHGTYAVEWDGRDHEGGRVSPGVYIWRVSVRGAAAEDSRSGTIAVLY